MKDPKVRAFHTLLARRGRVAERLRTQLASERREHARLAEAMNEANRSFARALEAERTCDAHIDAMITGTRPIRLSDINAQRRHRETLRDQRAGSERRMRECSDAVSRQEAAMAQTRQRIVKNDHSMELYRKRIDSMARAADARSEDQAHEEAEESHAARMLGRRAMRSEDELQP